MPVAGYTLALSWSPEYCRKGRSDTQCSGRNGRFGLIVHGLWPEGARGGWPQWCSAKRALSPETARSHLCMMPSPSLMAHEWAKHGSCMTATPDAYFKVTAILWRSLNLPDLDHLARRRDLKAADVRDAMARANPAIRRNSIAVITSRRGWLEEIRLCYGKDFMLAACPRGRLGAPDGSPVRIWRGL
jgi:ribonuclease T2